MVVGVGHHFGGGHGLALAGERFVGLVAECLAEVGDRGAEFGDPRRGEGVEGIERETGNGGRRFRVSEPIEITGEPRQCGAELGCVSRVVVAADRSGGVFERGERVTVSGLESAQAERQVCLAGAVTAVSSDHHAAAQGLEGVDGIGLVACVPVGEERVRQRTRVSAGLGGVDQTVGGGHRFLRRPGHRECEDQASPGERVAVAPACEISAAQLNPVLGFAAGDVRTAKPAHSAIRHLAAATLDKDLAGVAVADSLRNPSRHPALRCHHV